MRRIELAAVILIALALAGSAGYLIYPQIFSGHPLGSRIFVETDLYFLDALSVNRELRPICFGLVVGQPYTLILVAEKFMSHESSEMSVEIHLPPQFTVSRGVLTWRGTDKRTAISIAVVPRVQGDYIVEGTAVNLELSFSSTILIRANVRASIAEVIQACAVTKSTYGSVTTLTALQLVSIVGLLSKQDGSYALHLDANAVDVVTLRFPTSDLEMWAENHLGQRIIVTGYWDASVPSLFLVESLAQA